MSEYSVPDHVMRIWLKACRCCDCCHGAPCAGVMAGGVCDGLECVREEEGWDDDEDEF